MLQENETDCIVIVTGPQISVKAFHEILGLLLLNDSSVVSGLAQEAIAHTLLRLDGKAPPASRYDDPNGAARTASETDEASQPSDGHNHGGYAPDDAAKSLIVRDILEEVVSALCQLDADEPPEMVQALRAHLEEASRPNSHIHVPGGETPAIDDVSSSMRMIVQDRVY